MGPNGRQYRSNKEIVNTIVRGILGKEHGRAIAAAVDQCADILASHFPVKADNYNELANEVIIGR